MTVDDLIKMLSRLDKSLTLVVRGYEGGFDDVTDAKLINLQLDVNDQEYLGHHEDAEEHNGIPAVFLVSNRRS